MIAQARATLPLASLSMNGFDFALIAIIALSTLFAFARGIVRELIALATWVVGLVAAFAYAGTVACVVFRARHAPRPPSTSSRLR